MIQLNVTKQIDSQSDPVIWLSKMVHEGAGLKGSYLSWVQKRPAPYLGLQHKSEQPEGGSNLVPAMAQGSSSNWGLNQA